MKHSLAILSLSSMAVLSGHPEDSVPAASAESVVATESAEPHEGGEPAENEEKPELAADRGSIFNRPNARVMTLATPGVRGSIVDRNGQPLAVSKVSHYPALRFKQFEKGATREQIIAWGRERIAQANKIWGINWNPKDEQLWEHYRFRRWMAFPYTFFVVDAKMKKDTEKELMDGLVLHPIYQRYYPQGKSAAHIIGYTGITGKLEKGPINYGDPIFPYTQGNAGLEKLFDAQLRGRRGLTRTQFASDGTKFPEEVIQKPTVGGTVVTTLNLSWQKRAEKVLKERTKKGAIVIIDAQTGEVLTMASQPSFDPNLFVPRLLSKHFDPLRNHKDKPLYARAFQGTYPPASSFKPMVALAGLHSGVIGRDSLVDCPSHLEFNDHKFWDWSKTARGKMSVIPAIVRSNNVFFYKVGRSMRSYYFVDFAKRFGFGEKTGLPLVGEASGNMPDDTWMLKYHKRKMHTGDDYNNAIGQGVLLASPLQVAQAMAAVANGEYLPKLQLVRQVQDAKGKVVAANKPASRSSLGVSPVHIATVKEGMMKVVNASMGTGKSGRLSYATMCGKTGTGQWKPSKDPKKDQYVAWFAGFFPLKEPKYAFAILYEGDPGEKVSGGKNAAPIVKAFFEPLEEEIKDALSPAARPLIIVQDSGKGGAAPTPVEEGDIPKAVMIDPETGEEVIPRAVAADPDPSEEEEIPKVIVEQPAPEEDEEEIPKAIPSQPSEP